MITVQCKKGKCKNVFMRKVDKDGKIKFTVYTRNKCTNDKEEKCEINAWKNTKHLKDFDKWTENNW